MRRLLLFLSVVLLLVSGVELHAQTLLRPMSGPMVAVTTAQQDRILMFDLSTLHIQDGKIAEGLNWRELKFGAHWHVLWGFSPDGCRILYTLSDGTAPARLYSARLDGSDQRELVQYSDLPAEDWGVWEPQWSPDGSKIAFTMTRDQPKKNGSTERQWHIAWIDSQGGEPQFYSKTGQEHSPQWSPDGSWLAYVSYQQRAAGADAASTAVPTIEPPPGQPGQSLTMLDEADLWVVSADGSTKYNLTNFATGSVRDPRWSPNGQLMSFIYSPSAGNDTFWMIANQQDAIPTALSSDWVMVLDTTWLPDSTAILASVRDFQKTKENRLWTIPLVGNADTGAKLYAADVPELSYADFARFSPDGHWLALRSAYALALVNTADNTWALVDDAGLGNTPPVWSPAGFKGELACPSGQ